MSHTESPNFLAPRAQITAFWVLGILALHDGEDSLGPYNWAGPLTSIGCDLEFQLVLQSIAKHGSWSLSVEGDPTSSACR